MSTNERIDDAKRYTQRLWNYLPGLENITEIIRNGTDSESNDVENLLLLMLPHLKEIFNSDIAFVANKKGKIIKTSPEASLTGKAILINVADNITKSSENPIVLSDTEAKYPELKALNIHSIMVLVSRMQRKTYLIGVCNGKGKPEPYLGEDKRILKFIISFFHATYKSGHKFGQETEEGKDCLKRYQAALYEGNWADMARTSADLVKKHKNLTVLPDFLDAGLCEMILKTSLHQETGKTERGQIYDVNKKIGCFKIRLFKEDKSSSDIPIKKYKRAALAGARGLLYDVYSGEGTTKSKATSTGTAGLGVDVYEEWVKIIAEHTTWEKDNEEKDFYCRVDWLRTQWLRIYYLARSGSRHPQARNGMEIQSIYHDTWKKTVTIIQEHLKSSPEKSAEPGAIVINSDWLLAFLAQNALLSRTLAEHYRLIDPETSDMNLVTGARLFVHLSRFILYILHYIRFARIEAECIEERNNSISPEPFRRAPFVDVPLTPDSSLSSSIIFMISEYAYREIGVPRELLIFEKLSQQLNFELPLYAANEFYRDHCYHVIDVCLLGEFLLSCDNPTQTSPGGETIFPGLDDPKRGNYLKNWYVAALCHDLGYVVERVEKLVGPIEKLKASGLDQFNLSLRDGLKKGKGKLKDEADPLYGESDLEIKDNLKTQIDNRIETLDHGIIGWMYLCQVLKKLEIPFSTMKPALTAILRHNLCEHDEDIQEELLSLMLILCDHLQEWGRPRVETGQLATGVMEIMRFSPQESYFDRRVHLNQFSIKGLILKNPLRKELTGGICNGCINSNNCDKEESCLRLWPEIQDSGIRFLLTYHGDRITDFEPVLSWLLFCRDFQCQGSSFAKKLFPIAIHFSHPPSRTPILADEGVSELDIFEAFTNTNEEAAYLCQWVKCARNKDEGIEYIRECDSKTNKYKDEEFIIHLERLGRPLSRSMHRQQGKDFIKWKKDWWAEKYIARNS